MAAESSSEPAAAVTSDDDQQPLAANGDVPAPGPPAQDPDFVTLGMFIIGMCTSLATLCLGAWVCVFVSQSLSLSLPLPVCTRRTYSACVSCFGLIE